MNIDLVVVGSGFFGLTVAERCASDLGLRAADSVVVAHGAGVAALPVAAVAGRAAIVSAHLIGGAAYPLRCGANIGRSAARWRRRARAAAQLHRRFGVAACPIAVRVGWGDADFIHLAARAATRVPALRYAPTVGADANKV